jgi:hypothetical protein
MSPATKRSILLSLGLLLTFVITSAGAGTVLFLPRFWYVESASIVTASAEFDQIRARFGGEAPLVDMRYRKPSPDGSTPGGRVPLRSFHTIVFDTRGAHRLVRISVPYWFGTLYARHSGRFVWLGELTFFDDTEFDPEKMM